jgi:CRISPR-associated protein Cas2
MQTIVIYDITDDRIRARVADVCLDYGLERIQYSAFLGELGPNRREELLLKIKRCIGRKQARVHLFPICDKDLRLRKEVNVGKG